MSLLDKKLARQYDNASTQINVPPEIAAEIIRIGKELIPDEHLAGEGRPEIIHVTVKYGVKPDEQLLQQAIAPYKTFEVALGNIVVFPEGDDKSSPVVIEVHGHEFEALHKAIAAAMGTLPDDYPYTPHITVAYVKPKEAQHYAGNDSFVGTEFVAEAVTLSMFEDGNEVDVPLKTAAKKFYHGSDTEFAPGTVLKPSRAIGYPEVNAFLEANRPAGMLPRQDSVYLTDSPDAASWWGRFVYEVVPVGKVEKNDYAWFEDLIVAEKNGELQDSQNLAGYYWSGEPHSDLWEFRVSKAKVVGFAKSAARKEIPFKEEIAFIVSAWPVIYDDSPQGYTIQYPPFERDVKIFHSLQELRDEIKTVAARYEGKQDAIVTSGFVMHYDQSNEPKIRGLKELWEKPTLTKKAAAGMPTFQAWFKSVGGVQGFLADSDVSLIYEEDFREVADEDDSDAAFIAYITERMKEDYGTLARFFRKFKWPIPIYRAITVESVDHIDTTMAGVHWTWNADAPEAYWGEHNQGAVILKAFAKPSDVDWKTTITKNLHPSRGEDEAEITIKKGAKLQFAGYCPDKEYWGGNRKWTPLPGTKTVIAAQVAEIPEVAPQYQQQEEQPDEEEEVQRDEPATEQAEQPKPKKQPKNKLLQPKPQKKTKPKKPPVETRNFKQWFGKSKVRDDNGKPLVVYHGTTHDFEEFDVRKTNVENYYGQGLYFTSDQTDVGENYATEAGPDITSRISHRSEQIMQDWEDQWDDVKEDLGLGDIEEFPSYSDENYERVQERAKQEAKSEIAGQTQGMTMPVYLSLQNPVVVEKNGGTQFHIDIDEDGNESGNGVDLYNAMMRAGAGYYTDVQEVWGKLFENTSGDFNAWDFEKVVRDSNFEDDEGNQAAGNFISEVYQEMGFDGIIQDAYEAFGSRAYGKPMTMDYGTKHYILWDPTKIKSAIGNKGKFDPKNPNITAALLHDEAKQKAYFHGTDDEAAAQAIISGGIQPREITMPGRAKSRAMQAPVPDRVYMTDSIDYAAIYAMGGQMFGTGLHDQTKTNYTAEMWLENHTKNGEYGYIFEISGADLAGDVMPDEDSIGEALAWLLDYQKSTRRLKELETQPERWKGEKEGLQRSMEIIMEQPITHAPQGIQNQLAYMATYLTEGQRRRIQEAAVQAQVGKKLQKRLPEQVAKWLLDNGAHLAHQGPVFPSRCWRFSKKDALFTEDWKSLLQEVPLQHAVTAGMKIALNVPRLVKDFGQKFLARVQKDRSAPTAYHAPVETEEQVQQQATALINQIAQTDPSPNKEYTAWIVGNYARGGINRWEDIQARIIPALKKFDTLKLTKKLPVAERDIMKVKGIEGLEDLMEKYKEVEAVSEGQKERDVEQGFFQNGEAEIIHDDSQIKVIHPKSQKAACFFGINTRWCTAATEGRNYFEHYNKQGPLYIVLIKADNKRYQLHFESESYMDERDKAINPWDLTDSYPVLKKIFQPVVLGLMRNNANIRASFVAFVENPDTNMMLKAVDDDPSIIDHFPDAPEEVKWRAFCRRLGLPEENYDQRLQGFVVAEYANVEEFAEDRGDDAAKWAAKISNGSENLDSDSSGYEASTVLEACSDDTIVKINEYIKFHHDKELQEWLSDNGQTFPLSIGAIEQFISDADPGDLDDKLRSGWYSGDEMGAQDEIVGAFKSAVLGLESSGTNYGTSIVLDREKFWDTPVKEILPLADAQKLVEENPDGTDLWEDVDRNRDAQILTVRQPYYGFSGFSDEACNERVADEFYVSSKEKLERAEALAAEKQPKKKQKKQPVASLLKKARKAYSTPHADYKFPLTVWRALRVPKDEPLVLDNIGVHWTDWKSNMDSFLMNPGILWDQEDEGANPDNFDFYALEARILKPEDVDWDKTIRQNQEEPMEHEVTVNDMASLQLVSINGKKQNRYITAAGEKSVGDLGLARKVMHELMPVLGVQLPEPELKIVNSPRSGFLGQNVWGIGIDQIRGIYGKDNTTIHLQRSILNDENTLRRILAHELAHHADNLVNGPRLIEKWQGKDKVHYNMFRSELQRTAHGKGWKEYAQKFNAKYGADFVTEKSDETYATEEQELKPYHILLERSYDGTLSYEVSSRLSPKQKRYLDRLAQRQGKEGEYQNRITMTNDPDWVNGALIGSYSHSRPKEPEKQKKLEELWAKGQAPQPTGAAKEQDEILQKMRQYPWLNKKRTSAKNLKPLTKEFLEQLAWRVRDKVAPEGGEKCQEVSDAIVEKLERLGYTDAYTTYGQFRGEARHPHAWVRVGDWEIDATQDQFASYFEDEEALLDTPIYVGPPRGWAVSMPETKYAPDPPGWGNNPLLKKSAVPQLQQLEHGVSKDYDRVRWVYQQFYDNGIQSMSWQDFQKKFPKERNSPLFTKVRQNRSKITLDDMDRWMEEYSAKAKEYQNYEIEHDTYQDKATSFRDVEQLVLKINQSASAREIIGEDPMLTEFLGQIAQGSAQSGHPAGENTVGWLRVDFIDDDWLLVDEVQSDLINAMELGKKFLAEPTLNSLMSKYKSETVKQKIRDMGVSEQSFQMSKREMLRRGYTPEKLDEMKQQLANLFKDWAEYGIASLIEIARRHGIKNIAIHTGETIARRDPDLEADKAGMYYDQLAKSFGFQKQQLDVGDLKGPFWVRTASKVPKVLYHGTYTAYLPHILKEGLKQQPKNKTFDRSKSYVYLTDSPLVAEQWAYTGENPPGGDMTQTEVVSVDVSKLDKKRLHIDDNLTLPDECPDCGEDVVAGQDCSNCGHSFEAAPAWQYDGDIPPSAIKIASKTAGKRSEAVTSMTVGTTNPNFPMPVLIRWEQGMRWRQVLKTVKAIVSEITGRRVPWREIHIWASLWDNQQAQQEGWEQEKAKSSHVMYDVLHNGSYVRVDHKWLGSAEEPVNVTADSHKVTPLDDTYYNNPEIGEETNAYADIPERVRGTYDVPPLKTLAPQMFTAGETLEGVEYRINVLDSHRGELFCEAEAWLNDERIGVVSFNESEEDVDLENTEYYKEGEDEYGTKEWERIKELPKRIWIKNVEVKPNYRRKGIATGMYERIKQEFPGEKITSSGTTDEGTPFREKLIERGVLAHKSVLLLTAAERKVYYHGTAFKNLRPILTEGLVPEGKPKSWADDPNATISGPSKQTYGGIYLTRNLMTALGAPRDEKSKPDYRMVLVVVEGQPNSMFLDEDSIVGTLDSPFGNMGQDSAEHLVGQYFLMTRPDAPESMKAAFAEAQARYVEKTVVNFKRQLDEKELKLNPELEKRLRELLPSMFVASLTRRMAHAYKSDPKQTERDGYDARNYDYKRVYRQIFGEVEVPPKDTVIPSVQNAETKFRETTEQLTRTLRSLLRVQQSGGWQFQNARVTEPIGYSGSNRIVAVLEIQEGRDFLTSPTAPYRSDPSTGDKYMMPIVVHYGKVPEDFKQQWNERMGYKIYWLKPGEKPKYLNKQPEPESEPEMATASLLSKSAVYGEAQNQVQHTDHQTHGLTKTLKSDPFSEEMEALQKENIEPNPILDAGRSEGQPTAKGEDQLQMKTTKASKKSLLESLEALRPVFIQAAQEAYEDGPEHEWQGVCYHVAAAILEEALSRNPSWGGEVVDFGEHHSSAVICDRKDCFSVDIPFTKYEKLILREEKPGNKAYDYDMPWSFEPIGDVVFVPEDIKIVPAKRPKWGKEASGQVYLLHFDASGEVHHHLGWSVNTQERMSIGAKIAQERKSTFTVARVWEGADKDFELKLQAQGKLARWCPICHSLKKSAGTGNVEAAIAEIDATFPLNPLNERENIVTVGGNPVAVVEVAERSGRLRLRGIRSLQPREGAGSAALKAVTAIADKHGVEVELTASPYGPEADRLDKDTLQAWYRKNKFEDEPGYDPSLGYMVRKPKSAAGAVNIDWKKNMFEHFKLVPEFSWHEAGDKIDDDEEIGEDNWNLLVVSAFDTTKKQAGLPGKWVGSADFVLRGGKLESSNTEVDEHYWRQGIATAMYQYAEGFTGFMVKPHLTQSDAGRGLWQQKDRPFGKSGAKQIPNHGDLMSGGWLSEDGNFLPFASGSEHHGEAAVRLGLVEGDYEDLYENDELNYDEVSGKTQEAMELGNVRVLGFPSVIFDAMWDNANTRKNIAACIRANKGIAEVSIEFHRPESVLKENLTPEQAIRWMKTGVQPSKLQQFRQSGAANTVSGEDVVTYVQKLNKWDRQTAYQTVGLDAGGDYVLRDYPVSRLVAGDDYDPELAERYAKQKGEFPPIVLGLASRAHRDKPITVNYYVIRDGNHRVAAAKLRGDTKIKAYVPLDSTKEQK